MAGSRSNRLAVAIAGATAAVFLGAVTSAVTANAGSASIVGRWSRTTTCQDYVRALTMAGLRALAPGVLAGNGLVAGTPKQLAAKSNICAGATSRLHSHFFTADGRFGSVDWANKQVDDGHFTIIGNTLHFGPSVFRFTISANRLSLTPVISAAMKRHALAHPQTFSTAGWMIAVALPGGTWKRVPCNGWC
jgi:hypothetical protein